MNEYERELAQLRKELDALRVLTNFANMALGFQRVNFSALPTAANTKKIYYVLDGRKSGEAAGAGTGILAIDDILAAVATWVRVDDPTQAVTI